MQNFRSSWVSKNHMALLPLKSHYKNGHIFKRDGHYCTCRVKTPLYLCLLNSLRHLRQDHSRILSYSRRIEQKQIVLPIRPFVKKQDRVKIFDYKSDHGICLNY